MKGADCTRRIGHDIGKMPGMQILALDSSTEWLSVAVHDGSTSIVARERAGNAASERILPLVARVLGEAGTSLEVLGGIAYGAGPGSFTGVRIACGVVQGLAFGAGLPVYGVPTLGAIAHAAWRRHGWPRIVACLDARMHEVYVASYARHGDGWARIGDPAVRKPDAVQLADTSPWHGAGEGFAAYPALAQHLRLIDADASIAPDAESVAQWAWPHLLAGEGTDAAGAQPLYVRHRVALTTVERVAGLRL